MQIVSLKNYLLNKRNCKCAQYHEVVFNEKNRGLTFDR